MIDQEPNERTAPGRPRPAGPPLAYRLAWAARSRRGQSVVELALILPTFLLMTIGVIDMARVFASHVALTNAVREAALYGAIGPADTARITNRLKLDTDAGGLNWSQMASPTIQCTNAAAPSGWAACPTASATYVRVGVSYHMDLVTPLANTVGMTLSATTVVPALPQPSASP